MHLYLYARGKFEQLRLWESHAQASYWKWRRINQKTQKEEIKLVQGALRNSVLGAYEFVFPKEALTEVCAFFGIFENAPMNSGLSKIGVSARHLFLRKIFGARKIPRKILIAAKKKPSSFSTKEYERGASNCVIPGVAVHPIGIKDDVHDVMAGYYQEML